MEVFKQFNYNGYDKITPSMVDVFFRCPRQYYYRYVKKLPYEFIDNVYCRRGRATQKLFELIINDNMWEAPATQLNDLKEQIATEEDFENFEEIGFENFEPVFNYFKRLNESYDIISEDWLKYGLKDEDGGWSRYLLGRIDFKLLDKGTQNVVGILDGKSTAKGKRNKYYGRLYHMLDDKDKWCFPLLTQLLFYGLPFLETLRFVGFLYWNDCLMDGVNFDAFSKELVLKDISTTLTDLFNRGDDENNYIPSGDGCRYCQYGDKCGYSK